MKKYFVVSAVGPDRPGFINRISHAIKEAGGNIELTRSTRMAAEFAALFLFSIDDDGAAADEAVARLNRLRDEQLVLNVRPAVAEAGGPSEDAGHMQLVASGADQPGIIDAVTLILFQANVNVEAMDYDTESAPMTGESLFRMSATLAVPPDLDVEGLRGRLTALEAEYNFDVDLCAAGDRA